MKYLHGGDIYTYEGMTDFSINVNPLGPDPAVLDAVREAVEQVGAYPDNRCRKLKRALAEKLEMSEDMLLFGNGAADLIFSLVFAVKPKKALLCAPSFSEYERALGAVGCEISWYDLKEENYFYLCPDYLDWLTEEVDIIFLCTPHNPTGNIIESGLFQAIIEKCQRMGILAVVDECFLDFLEDGDYVQGAALLKYSHLFLLRAFTKIDALPGLRLGYGITADQVLLQKLEAVRQPWSVSSLAQAAGLAALQSRNRLERVRTFVKEERERLMQEFNRLGITYFPSMVNYILVKSHYDLFILLLKDRMLIRDCSNYRGLTKGYYRVAVKSKEENQLLVKALAAIYESGDKKDGC